MSELDENDFISCQNCGIAMNKVFLCKNRSRSYTDNNEMILRRCVSIICEDCEHCHYHRSQYQELKNRLVELRYGKPFPKSGYESIIEKLASDFNEDLPK